VDEAALLRVLRRLEEESVAYILVGGFAVRFNGFVRATRDIDLLLPSSVENGRKLIRALDFLPSSQELDPSWFETDPDEPENIRIADEVLIDLLFSANGHDYQSLQPHVRLLDVQGVAVRTLDLDGLLKTKQTLREQDQRDCAILEQLRSTLEQLEEARRRLRDIPAKGPAAEEPSPSMGRGGSAVSRAGFDAASRALVVQFDDGPALFGYADLDDAEVTMLEGLMDDAVALSRYVNGVIRPRHDDERVQF
jgi:predicted nucleotidyltransferase